MIMAADGVKTWNRHAEKIGGETLLERIVRQLKARGISDILISARGVDQHRVAGASIVVNHRNGNDLGCIAGVMEADSEIYLFGDVWYTDVAMDSIIIGTENFYGRSKAGETKAYGEMFAIKMTPELDTLFRRLWQKYLAGEMKRLWSWDLYSADRGKDFYKHRNTGNFVEIHDMTEDFDKPSDLDRWKEKYAIA